MTMDIDDLKMPQVGDFLSEEEQAKQVKKATSEAAKKAAQARAIHKANVEEEINDSALARRIASELGETMTFVTEWKKWAVYEPAGYWIEASPQETERRVIEWIEKFVEEVKTGGDSVALKAARAYLNTGPRTNLIKTSAAFVNTSSARFDRKKDLLLTASGVVNLRTGEIRAARPDDLFTKYTPYSYEPGFKHELWEAVLGAFPDDAKLYLQRVVGNGLTGYQPSDASVFFFKGGGRNGKTTFLECLKAFGGSNVVSPPSSLLIGNRDGGAEPELMMLKGARTALIEELPDAKHLNALAVKRVSGSKTLSARLLHQNTETFEVTNTVFITANVLPRVAETDDGTWRRLVVIPAPYKFIPEGDPLTEPNHRRQNDALVNAEENEDIIKAGLAWAVEGAMLWFANGMKEYSNDSATSKDMRLPDSVSDASATWRENDDKIGSWIDARLDQDGTSFVLLSDAYDSYKEYLKSEGRQAEAASTFRVNFNQNARAKDLGLIALAKDRHTGLNHSMYEPEEVALYGRSYTARTAPTQANSIRGARFK